MLRFDKILIKNNLNINKSYQLLLFFMFLILNYVIIIYSNLLTKSLYTTYTNVSSQIYNQDKFFNLLGVILRKRFNFIN